MSTTQNQVSNDFICDRCHQDYATRTANADGLCPTCAPVQVAMQILHGSRERIAPGESRQTAKTERPKDMKDIKIARMTDYQEEA